ncbi:MAG: NAD-dependent epimerase/dehydratase family protein [Rhizobiales bacterium]|nr:NAD-dependent epimerase/dehydratase family protein [Hyphomicrobiales bacterium]
MTTIVTGAGLIGTAFAQNAIARGEQVVFVDPEPRADFLKLKLGDKGYTLARYDVRDLPNLIATIKQNGANTVVHTAGLIGNRVQQSLNAGFDINVGGTRNVAEAVRLAGVRRLVHISTFGVYDRRRETGDAPVKEDFPRGGARAYGAFKAAKELILEAYAAAYKFEVIMLRPANVFGLGHFWSGSSGGQKMQRLIEAGLAGSTARIPSSETMANEYIYAKDIGRAVDAAATAKQPPQIHFNIGNGYVSTFEDVLAAVKALCPDVRYDVEPGEPPHSKIAPLDISAARQHLGWEPRFTLQSAFEDYLDELKAARSHAKSAFDDDAKTVTAARERAH